LGISFISLPPYLLCPLFYQELDFEIFNFYFFYGFFFKYLC
jgi:hypothetical protein